MGKKTAEMAYTSKQIKSSKWLLLLCAASAAAVDVAIMVLLIIGGMGAAYLTCPIILFAFDVIYFVVSLCFTNFRFKYSLAVWISYLVLYAVGMAIQLSLLLGGTGTVISNFALIIWSAVHALNIVCAIVAALYSSRVLKHIWLGIAFAVVFILGCGGYITYICTSGFFGQGLSSRPLVFKYDSSAGEYTAIDVLAGRSKKVVVPATFNGKPVTTLSFNVLANSGVKEYSFAADIKFTDEEVLDNQLDLSGKSFFVDKDAVNDVRATLYGYTGSAQRSANAVALANATLPTNLSEGEGYVAFVYDANSYALSKGKVLPVYVGDLSAFDISAYTADYDYITNRDAGNVVHLDWAFKNGGYILNDIVGSEGSVLKGSITGNTIAELKFDKIYRVTVGNGNDTKYDEHELQPDFCFDTIGGVELSYRYVTLETAKSFTSGLNGRKGFSVSWVYKDGSSSQTLNDLSATLGDINGSDLTISPVWALNAPDVSIEYSAKEITYGEDVTFNALAEIEAEGVVLEYRWSLGGDPVTDYAWNEDSVELTHPKIEEGGEYKLVVLVTGGEVTSLTTEGRASVMLSIAKKPVEFVWTTPYDLVYDGGEKVVTFTFDNDQLVGDDSIQYAVPAGGEDHGFLEVGAGTYTVKYAGTYSPEIMVSGADAVNYDAGDTLHFTFTVAKRAVDVVWSNYDNLVYNAAMQGPSASATGVSGDGDVINGVTGQKINAGDNYTATATLNNSNYTLNNPTQVYSIAKAPLTITAGSASAVYGNSPDESAITLGYSGFVGNESYTVLGGAPVYTFLPSINSGTADYNVGTYSDGVAVNGYTALNYEIEYVNGSLTITPRVIDIDWKLENPVYNAQAKTVTATVSNILTMDAGNVNITVAGNGYTNAGEYTATATGLEGSRKDNYILPEDKTWDYEIEKAQVTIVADDISSVYGDDIEELSATISGTIYNEEITYSLYVEWTEDDFSTSGYYKADSYAIKVTIEDDDDNYTVEYEDGTYTVTPKIIKASDITWTNHENQWAEWLVYTGTEKEAYANIISGVLLGNDDVIDDVTVVVRHEIISGSSLKPIIDSISVGAHNVVADSLSGADADNYQLDDGIKNKYTIDAAILKVIWMCNGEIIEDSAKLVYDGTEKVITATIENMAECDEEYVTYKINCGTDVGTYTAAIELDISIMNNYTFNNPSNFLIYYIVKAESRLAVYYNDSAIEDGAEITISSGESIRWECDTFTTVTVANYTNVIDDSDSTPEVPSSGNTYVFSEAGKFTVVITTEGDNNYNGKTITFTVNVVDEDADDIESQPENA